MPVFFFTRILGGVATAIYSVTIPSFLSEIAPTKLKGPIIGLAQVAIVFGFVSSNFMQIAQPEFTRNRDLEYCQTWDPNSPWRVFLTFTAIPSSIQFLLLLFVFQKENPGVAFASAFGRTSFEEELGHTLHRQSGNEESAELSINRPTESLCNTEDGERTSIKFEDFDTYQIILRGKHLRALLAA